VAYLYPILLYLSRADLFFLENSENKHHLGWFNPLFS